ncbi:hypothetical protein N7G274_003916 [Stereocaulon virgatum]|uniref:Rhodopsin domain-containing protein n=1 Tax=Stereocaulon virgatum TaxID=373712 RepID=A0ABR4AFX6_9LECA
MSKQQPAKFSTFAFVYHGNVIAAGAALPAVGIIVVALRYWTRVKRKTRLGIDDWLMVPALLCVIGMGACLIVGAKKHVMGYPTPATTALSPADEVPLLLPGQGTLELIEWVFWSLMILAYGFIKLSATFFYRRIFVAQAWSAFDIVTKITITFIIMWTIGFFLVNVFGCGKHFSSNWGTFQKYEQCVDGVPELTGMIISDFITDLIVLILPFPIIWRLHMTTTRKFAVTVILLLGASSLGASLARMVLQIQVNMYGYRTKADVYLTITAISYWSMIEAGLAVIAVCLPTLQTLLTRGSVQSLVASVRSAISLRSMRLHSSHGSRNFRTGQNSYSEMPGVESGAEDIIALTNVERLPHVLKPENAHIGLEFA